MTFAQLKAAIDKLTPAELEKPVLWCGDDRGGEIDTLSFADEDAIRDEGDTGEIFSRSDFEEDCGEDVERLSKGVVTCAKGSPILFTDGV